MFQNLSKLFVKGQTAFGKLGTTQGTTNVLKNNLILDQGLLVLKSAKANKNYCLKKPNSMRPLQNETIRLNARFCRNPQEEKHHKCCIYFYPMGSCAWYVQIHSRDRPRSTGTQFQQAVHIIRSFSLWHTHRELGEEWGLQSICHQGNQSVHVSLVVCMQLYIDYIVTKSEKTMWEKEGEVYSPQRVAASKSVKGSFFLPDLFHFSVPTKTLAETWKC